jgi:hypothetical protein
MSWPTRSVRKASWAWDEGREASEVGGRKPISKNRREAVERLCGYEEEVSWVDLESGDFETR